MLKKKGADTKFIDYADVQHGFAVRALDPVGKAAALAAKKEAIDFFNRVL